MNVLEIKGRMSLSIKRQVWICYWPYSTECIAHNSRYFIFLLKSCKSNNTTQHYGTSLSTDTLLLSHRYPTLPLYIHFHLIPVQGHEVRPLHAVAVTYALLLFSCISDPSNEFVHLWDKMLPFSRNWREETAVWLQTGGSSAAGYWTEIPPWTT